MEHEIKISESPDFTTTNLVSESVQTVHHSRSGPEITFSTLLVFLVVLGLLSNSRSGTAVYSLQMSTYWFVLEAPICSTPVKDVGLKPGKGRRKTVQQHVCCCCSSCSFGY